jgi:hypothetical protein
MENRDKVINDAQAEALRKERDQEAASLEVIRNAQAAKEATIALAKAQRDAFMSRYGARTKLSLQQEALLQLGALQSAMRGRTPEEVESDFALQRAAAVKQQADLTDFRLYWNMLAASLTNREKIIVDAEKVPGRRHLFLVPLEPFRFMPPPPMPPRREEP